MFEIDLELVAFHLGDDAIAEFRMEDALADGDIAPTRITETDGAGPGFDHPGRIAIEGAAAGCALPPGTPAAAAGNVGEGISPFRPVGAPKRLAAAHRRFLIDMR